MQATPRWKLLLLNEYIIAGRSPTLCSLSLVFIIHLQVDS